MSQAGEEMESRTIRWLRFDEQTGNGEKNQPVNGSLKRCRRKMSPEAEIQANERGDHTGRQSMPENEQQQRKNAEPECGIDQAGYVAIPPDCIISKKENADCIDETSVFRETEIREDINRGAGKP